MVTAVKRGCGLTRTDDSAIMTVAEMKSLRNNVGSEEFEHRIGLHCKELFDLNEHGFFDGFKFIKSELFEDVVVDDPNVEKPDTVYKIVYKCANRDDGYDYSITVSFDGSVMFGPKVVNIFKGARFGDKFVTEKGDVVIYEKQNLPVEYRGCAIGSHILMSKYKMFYAYDNGEIIGNNSIDSNVVGRLSDEDLDIVKAYVKKELGDKDVDGYMQGFIDGYNNCVIL